MRTGITAVVFALAGCLDATPPSSAPLTNVAQPSIAAPPAQTRNDAFCDHRRFYCRPNDASAQQICDYACLLPSHCQDYYPSDYSWCALHPDTFDRYGRYCDQWGNPDWNTTCVAGPRP